MSDLIKLPDVEAVERTLIQGDLSKLTPEQRILYYRNLCESLGLNPMTKPFEYISMGGKLVLYAKKDCTEQLRKKYGVSIIKLEPHSQSDLHVVIAHARSSDGREDVATGAVSTQGLKGEALANALMKAETKAKRRVTLSICGLAMLDETEVATVPLARPIAQSPVPQFETPKSFEVEGDAKGRANALLKSVGLNPPMPEPIVAETVQFEEFVFDQGRFKGKKLSEVPEFELGPYLKILEDSHAEKSKEWVRVIKAYLNIGETNASKE